MQIEAIDHVQLAMPPGGEDQAREFYCELLGIPEVPKPSKLAASGGVWFERGGLRVHLGVQPEFQPALKAHPGFRVSALSQWVERLRAAGITVIENDSIPGIERVFVSDPFGNRLEFLEPRT